jgi:hypothetical protein
MMSRPAQRAFFVPLLVAAFGASACADSPSGPTGRLNERIVVAVGQTVRVPDARFAIRFDGVTGDSRCPADALCVLGGDAVVGVTITPSPGSAARYALHTGGPSAIRHNGFTVTLEQLSPYPFSARPIDPSTYEATLRVSE